METLFKHHIFIVGATGSGKSYVSGVLIEEFLDKGIPVVIIDPHGEYFTLSQANDSIEEKSLMSLFNVKPKAYDTSIYSITSEENKLTFRLEDFGPEGLAEICNMTEIQSDLIYLAFKYLKDRGFEYNLDNLLLAVEEVSREYRFTQQTILAVKRRLAVLEELNILGEGFNPEDMVKNGTATIIDLSGDIAERVRRALAGALILKLFEARKRGKIPPFLLVIDEGHRFAPQEEECYSKKAIEKVAREGRKFGICLCIVSQRIVGLDKDVFSQAGTKIFFRLNCTTDLTFVQPFLEREAKEYFEILPLLPRGVAVLSSIAVRTPLLVRIRVRKSKHGGVGVKLARVVRNNGIRL